ncbi:MAG: polysaccharide biosynthesis protein [Candidatus Nezhaarchaeota archaeon]|nr:polysaccharide biosynthesis protein [Candidatus Nezhaarchaeota archaeon]MCX8142207.1 polysaccharide biosynthesis protein [Candidatus Nezhaarchaeota archaeon]MDW8050009.1 glycosyltransferase [Nitrososphaerota archaeon]
MVVEGRGGKLLIIAGYGGHAGYAFAVLHELLNLGFRDNVIVIAEGYDYLVNKFKNYGEIFRQIIPRKVGEALYKGVHRWAIALYQSLKLSFECRFNAVFSTGSNFSIPLSLISKVLLKPLFTIEAIEHFKIPSRAIKMLEMIGATVFLHWEEQLEMYPKGVVVGPVYEPPLYEPRDLGYVLVTTGTLGYKELFDAVEKLELENVVLQTGDVDPESYLKRNPKWMAFRYTSDIHKWIANASLVITQQGLTASIARLAYGKPTIIVWNPRVRLGAVKRDVEVYAEKLRAIFIDKVEPHAIRRAMNEAGPMTLKSPNGAREIAKILLRHVK